MNPIPHKPSIILITGIMAAGKSTVAQQLAERLPRSVHLRGDVFRRMIVRGQAQMDFELTEEALSQLQLRYRIAAAAAELYLEAGFTVVYQDIILGPALTDMIEVYRDHNLYVVVLCPSPTAVAAREEARPKSGYSDRAAVVDFDRVLREQTAPIGLWLDSSQLSVSETVDQILAKLDQARINQS